MEPAHGGCRPGHEHSGPARRGPPGSGRRGAPAPLRPARLLHPRGLRGRRRRAPRRAGHPHRGPHGHHRLRPAPGPVRRRAPVHAGRVARGLPGRHCPRHSRLGQRAHRRSRPRHHPGGARLRPQRRGVRRPLPDRHGRGHQPLLPRRPDLPDDPGADLHVRHPGRQRRRLGPLRGSGEGPPAQRLPAVRLRPGLAPPGPADDLHGLLVHHHRPVALRHHLRRAPGLTAGAGEPDGQDDDRHNGRGHEARVDAVLPDLQPQPAAPGPAGRRGGHGPQGLRRRAAALR